MGERKDKGRNARETPRQTPPIDAKARGDPVASVETNTETHETYVLSEVGIDASKQPRKHQRLHIVANDGTLIVARVFPITFIAAGYYDTSVTHDVRSLREQKQAKCFDLDAPLKSCAVWWPFSSIIPTLPLSACLITPWIRKLPPTTHRVSRSRSTTPSLSRRKTNQWNVVQIIRQFCRRARAVAISGTGFRP